MAANAEPLEEPEPSHSGRLLLRMPRTLHAELAARSDAEGVSLNQFIVAALSRAASTDGTESEGSRAPARPMSSTLRLALIANAVVVALAAATAIALIVIAWR
jgi:hypothetical protein